MIDRILIAVEDDEERMVPVVEHAAEIAAALSAEVVLHHVYEPDAFAAQVDAMPQESADPTELAKQHAVVESAAATLRDRGVSFSVVGATGDPAAELIDYVADHGIDHVFLGAHDRSPAGKALLGSVSQRVLRNAGTPCTIIMG